MTPDLGAWGAIIAILAMGLASYLCRISGVVLMGYVPLTLPYAEGWRPCQARSWSRLCCR